MENKTQQQKETKKQHWPGRDARLVRQHPFPGESCSCYSSTQPLTQQQSAEVRGPVDSSRDKDKEHLRALLPSLDFDVFHH